MTVIRALANSSNSLGPDRRESAIPQELHRYCPNFAMRLGGTSQSFNLGLTSQYDILAHLFSDVTTTSLRSAFCGMKDIIAVGEGTK